MARSTSKSRKQRKTKNMKKMTDTETTNSNSTPALSSAALTTTRGASEDRTSEMCRQRNIPEMVEKSYAEIMEKKYEDHNREVARRHKPDPLGQVLERVDGCYEQPTEHWMEIYLNVCEDLQMLRFPIHLADHVSVRRTLRTSLGKCYCEKIWDKQSKQLVKHYYIYFNPALLDVENDEVIRDTFAHELIHTIDSCMNHSEHFKHYAAIANYTLGYHVTTTFHKETYEELSEHDQKILSFRAENPAKDRYQLQCTGCDKIYSRQKLSAVVKHPEDYRCSICGSKLIRIK